MVAWKKFNADDSMCGIKPMGAGSKVWICKEEEALAEERLVIENPGVFKFKLVHLHYI